MAVMLGMRGTGDVQTDERPKSWREGLLHLDFNGDVPVTAVLSKGGSEKVNDPEFSWWEKSVEARGGAMQGSFLYDDAALSSATASTALTAGAIKYASVLAATSAHARPGMVALTVLTTDMSKVAHWLVTEVSSTRVTLKLLANIAANIADVVDWIDFIGTANAEGGAIPESLSYTPVKRNNYTQIFWNSLEMTRTMMRTKLRTGNQYAELKRETLYYHSEDMEKTILFGQKSETTGSNGKPQRSTQGMFQYMLEHASANYLSYSTVGTPWLVGGEEWLDEALEQYFRKGRGDVMAVGGSGVALGLNKLVKANGQFEFEPETVAYGIKVSAWTTNFGTIYFKRHPLFTKDVYRRNDVMIFRPQNITYKYIDDTHFLSDKSEDEAGFNAIDGRKEAFKTECGFEFHHAETFMYLSRVGLDT